MKFALIEMLTHLEIYCNQPVNLPAQLDLLYKLEDHIDSPPNHPYYCDNIHDYHDLVTGNSPEQPGYFPDNTDNKAPPDPL